MLVPHAGNAARAVPPLRAEFGSGRRWCRTGHVRVPRLRQVKQIARRAPQVMPLVLRENQHWFAANSSPAARTMEFETGSGALQHSV
jgi:hypothetical protein